MLIGTRSRARGTASHVEAPPAPRCGTRTIEATLSCWRPHACAWAALAWHDASIYSHVPEAAPPRVRGHHSRGGVRQHSRVEATLTRSGLRLHAQKGCARVLEAPPRASRHHWRRSAALARSSLYSRAGGRIRAVTYGSTRMWVYARMLGAATLACLLGCTRVLEAPPRASRHLWRHNAALVRLGSHSRAEAALACRRTAALACGGYAHVLEAATLACLQGRARVLEAQPRTLRHHRHRSAALARLRPRSRAGGRMRGLIEQHSHGVMSPHSHARGCSPRSRARAPLAWWRTAALAW